MMSGSKRAIELFKGGFNCCQAVLAGLCGELGLKEQIALKIACGFGSGIARRQEICGAVSGAVMVIGLKYGRDRIDDRQAVETTYTLAQTMIREFTELHGSACCRDLLRCDISTAEGRKQAEAAGLFATKCTSYVEDAARLVERIVSPSPA